MARMMVLASTDPLAGANLLGVPAFYWERPLAQEAIAGWGEAAVMEAHSSAQATEVRTTAACSARARLMSAGPPMLTPPRSLAGACAALAPGPAAPACPPHINAQAPSASAPSSGIRSLPVALNIGRGA